MKRIQSLNPDRILWCCNQRNITSDELAQQAGISENILNDALGQGKGLTYLQLRKLADFFHRSVLFFVDPSPVEETKVHTPQFRTIANQKPEITPKLRALIERVERQRDIYIALKEDLGHADQNRFSIPDIGARNVKESASIVREWLGLQYRNSFATYRQAIEERGILVFRSNGYRGKWQIAKDEPVCGFTVYQPQCPVIVVKKFDSLAKQAFTLMHELAHVILHQSSFIDEESDLWSYHGKEREANQFASFVLVPDAFVNTVLEGGIPEDYRNFDEWLMPYRKLWGVSSYVILLRLVNSGRLDQHHYDAYRAWREEQPETKKDTGRRQYRYREPRAIFGEPYVRTVLDALSNRRISLVTASNYLDNLKISDLQELERSYADA